MGPDRTPRDLAHAESLRCDFTSDESVEAAIRQVKARHGARIASVVHPAGYFDFSGEPDPRYQQVNVEGTRRLLRTLQALEVEQFVYASTMLVHAPTRPGVPINEDSPVEPRWVYPRSRLETEGVVEREHGDIPYVLLRIAGVYSQVVQPRRRTRSAGSTNASSRAGSSPARPRTASRSSISTIWWMRWCAPSGNVPVCPRNSSC